jgi:hypothetical protein
MGAKKTKIVRCIGKKGDGSRCTREKEVPIDFEGDWRCWQHPPEDKKKEVNAGGRPSKYDPSIIPKVEEWAKEGLIDYEISKRLGIDTSTLYDWKNKFPEFSKALKKNKSQADFRVENSLFKRANGYRYDEVTKELVKNPRTGELELVPTKVVTKEVKPNPTSIIFWLKNRQSDKWSDKKEIDLEGNIKGTIKDPAMNELSVEELKKLAEEL